MIFSGTGPRFSTVGYIFFSCLIDIQTNEERYNFSFMSGWLYSLPLCERLALFSVVWLLLIVFSFLCCGLCVCVFLFFCCFFFSSYCVLSPMLTVSLDFPFWVAYCVLSTMLTMSLHFPFWVAPFGFL